MAERVPFALRWSVLGVLIVISLVVGSGVLNSSSASHQERAHAIDTRLKSPDSTGLSVAQSTSASAAAIRADVRSQVNQGRGDDEIIASLEARYGTAVLLTPPGGGLSILLWLLPALLLIGIALSAVVVARRRRLPTGP
jgi:cytochrome c-type biogenesis protein CcmH